MYNCSSAFHTAVANGNPQKALLIFSDCVFTNDDINVENGIEFADNFNLEEDLSIGQTPSNEVSFSLFNDDRLLNSYEFGEFTATIGVQIRTQSYTAQEGSVTCDGQSGVYLARSGSPYLTKNGSAVSHQPSQRITAMLAYGGKLYCFGNNGYSIVYNESNMSVASVSVNAFMKKKAATFWQGKGMSYQNRILKEWQGGVLTTWEFVPLGVFDAERPKVPNVIEIDFVCYDRMQRFEKDMPSKADLGFGEDEEVSIGRLYAAMCNYVGVPYQTTNFINADATFEWPKQFENTTMRNVIGWIAEAAASNARFNRDGVLVLDWLKSTGQSYSEGKYTEFLPYWYQTQKVTKLYNRNTTDVTDNIYGEGSAAYLIQDNPLLKGVS